MNVYVVGKYLSHDEQDHMIWVYMGIFDKEEEAVKACINEAFFYFETPMNTVFSKDTEDLPYCHFPVIEREL